MLQLSYPPNIIDYVLVTEEQHLALHKAGFQPKYMCDGNIWYEYSKELDIFLTGGETNE